MATIEKLEADIEIKSEAIKVWGAVKDSPNFFPKAMPHHYKSIEIVDGADHVVGSVRLVTYADGNPIKTTKEKIDVVDDEKKTLAYSVVDGEGITHYKSFKAQVVVEEKGEGSLVKWTCEYEKIKPDEELPISPENLKEFAVATFKELDDFLLKAN